MKWLFVFGVVLASLSGAYPQEFEEQSIEDEVQEKPNITLTGIPQIDYVWDPNLPRELNGYNLSTYPFLNSMPKNLTFKCDGQRDGFYASVEYNCQVYHQCLFGTRFDFLCANFTAFSQKNFNCIFANDVDCPNSPLFFHRNEELYKPASTTTEVPPFLGLLRNQRPRRPHPQLARLRNGQDGGRFDTFEDDYDLPIIPQQKAEVSQLQLAGKAEAQVQDAKPVRAEKDLQDLEENNQIPPLAGSGRGGPGKNRAIQQRRRPGRPLRRRPVRPVYYDDYYEDYENYDDATGNEYDYDYGSNNRFANRRPGGRRPGPGKAGQRDSQQRDAPQQQSTPKQSGSTPAPLPQQERLEPEVTSVQEERLLDAAAAQEQTEQVLPTPEDRKKLFQQQRGPSKVRPPSDVQKVRTTTTTTTTTPKTSSSLPATTTTKSPAQELEYDYEYEYEDDPTEDIVVTPKTTTAKPEPAPKLQPAFRRAGLPERQVRTEEPVVLSPQNKETEANPGAAKLRNRLQNLKVASKEADVAPVEEADQVSTPPVNLTVKPTSQPATGSRRLLRPSAVVEKSGKEITESPKARNTDITTFRRLRSRQFGGTEITQQS